MTVFHNQWLIKSGVHGAHPVWRYATAAVLDALAAENPDRQLSPREKRESASWRDPRRRQEFLRGRVLCKQLITEQLGAARASEVEILSRDANGLAIRPQALLAGRPLPLSVSIAHTEHGVLAAIGNESLVRIGVDLMPRGPLPAGFARMWFTRAEQAWFANAGSSEIGSFLWAAKEAVYKACNHGEPFDPAAIEILSSGAGTYRGRLLAQLRLRSWEIDKQVAVVASVEAHAAASDLLCA